jgi:hypothetical protein
MKASKRKVKDPLDPNAPGLDEQTRRRRRALAEWERLSPEELHAFMIRVGIFTKDGKLAPQYRSDAEPSACRPTD